MDKVKVCNSCKRELEISNFTKRKDNLSDGYYCKCRECIRAKNLKWKEDHPNYFKNYNKEHYHYYTKDENQGECCRCHNIYPRTEEFFIKSTADKRKDGLRSYCRNCSTQTIIDKDFLQNNPDIDKRKFFQHKYTKLYKDIKKSKYYEKIKISSAAWRLKNIEKVRKNRNKWKYNKRLNDIDYKLKENISSLIRLTLKENKTPNRTIELLGCSIQDVRNYIESKFKPGMTWDNWSLYGWHIDHIKPRSSFDFKDYEQQKECFHYTNLQPLWCKENIQKSNNI